MKADVIRRGYDGNADGSNWHHSAWLRGLRRFAIKLRRIELVGDISEFAEHPSVPKSA